MSLFKKAARLKLRFPTTKGLVSLEDLWDLPLTSARGASLDDTARKINATLKADQEESFVETKTATNTTAEIMLNIVKEVIADIQAENAEKLNAAAKKEQREKIMAIMASKQDDALNNLPLEKLAEMLEAL